MVCHATNDKKLLENINRFLGLQATWILDTKTSIYDKFKEYIKFKNSCCTVKLLVQEFNPLLPDNYRKFKET